MSNNFWDKLQEDIYKEMTKDALIEWSRTMYTLYKNLIEEGFKPHEALYLLGELIKGGMK